MKEIHSVDLETHEEWLAFGVFVTYHSKRLRCRCEHVFVHLQKESKQLNMAVEVLQPVPKKRKKKDDDDSPKILKRGPMSDD